MTAYELGVKVAATVWDDPRLYSGATGWDAWQAPEDNPSTLKLTPQQVNQLRKLKLMKGLTMSVDPDDMAPISLEYSGQDDDQLKAREAIHQQIRQILDRKLGRPA